MESLFGFNLSVLLIHFAPIRLVEVLASLLSCWGAYRVARFGHSPRAVMGWGAWLLAGVLWVVFAVIHTYWFMGLTQAYFLYTAWLGFRNSRRNQDDLLVLKTVSHNDLKGAQHG